MYIYLTLQVHRFFKFHLITIKCSYLCFWFLQLEPIVDTISEHEKYGNNGDMFDGIARSIVNGYEAFSNLLNALIQVSEAFILTILKNK